MSIEIILDLMILVFLIVILWKVYGFKLPKAVAPKASSMTQEARDERKMDLEILRNEIINDPEKIGYAALGQNYPQLAQLINVTNLLGKSRADDLGLPTVKNTDIQQVI